MKCFYAKVADLCIKVEHRDDFTREFFGEYVCSEQQEDFVASVTDVQVQKEYDNSPNKDMAYCESICLYRAIAEKLPAFNRFVFHGAAISYNNNAIIFTAKSGTGKTTHIRLWKKALGDQITVINGDKPIIKVDDGITVYGTPYAGKEKIQTNTSAPLKKLCLLKRGTENKIYKIDAGQSLTFLMSQIYMPIETEAKLKTLELLDRFISKAELYVLECDISKEAFETSFSALAEE